MEVVEYFCADVNTIEMRHLVYGSTVEPQLKGTLKHISQLFFSKSRMLAERSQTTHPVLTLGGGNYLSQKKKYCSMPIR